MNDSSSSSSSSSCVESIEEDIVELSLTELTDEEIANMDTFSEDDLRELSTKTLSIMLNSNFDKTTKHLIESILEERQDQIIAEALDFLEKSENQSNQ